MFKAYREWKSRERAADRAVLLEAVSVLRSAFEAQAEQSKVFARFLESFNVASRPEIREWDEDASLQRYLDAHGAAGANLPPELEGLNRMEQFERILERMGED